jgi:ATP-binding cassette subfamily C protein
MEAARASNANPWSMSGRFGPALDLAAAFFRFVRPQAPLALVLMLAGSLLEGAGMLLVVPVLALLLGQPVTGAGVAPWANALVAWSRGLWPAAPILPALCLFVAVTVTRALVVVAREARLTRLHLAFMESLRNRLAAALAGAGWSSLSRIRHARVSHALSLGVERCGAAVFALLQLGACACLGAGALAVALVLSLRLTLLTLGVVAVASLVLAGPLQRAQSIGEAVGEAGEAMVDSAAGFLGGLKLTLSHGRTDLFLEDFRGASSRLAESRLRFVIARAWAGAVTNLLIALAAAALVALAAGHAGLSGPVLLAFLALSARLAGPAVQAYRALLEAVSESAAWRDIIELEAALAPCAVTPPAGSPRRAGSDTAVVVDGVTFRHPGGRGVEAIDLTLQPGDILGVRGPSGAGKTTLADLVAGLLEPQSGEIRVAGQVLSGAVRFAWSARIAYMTQDPFLFHRSLADNLRWARPDASDDMLWRALETCEVADLARALPDGLDTVLGDRGSLVSGGERQRFALARGVLRAPELMILDEAMNAVDAAVEARILRRLADLVPRPTLMIIAHRPQGLAICDRIVTLCEGRLDTDQPLQHPATA